MATATLRRVHVSQLRKSLHWPLGGLLQEVLAGDDSLMAIESKSCEETTPVLVQQPGGGKKSL